MSEAVAPPAVLFSRGSRSSDAHVVVQTGPDLSASLSPACLVFGCHGAVGDSWLRPVTGVTQRFFMAFEMG